MKGIASIKGEKLPKIDQEHFYEVASLYPGTVIKNEQDIKWKLFTQEDSGRWRELRGTLKQGRRVSFTFPQKWYGKKLLVEAFIDHPEIKEPPGMVLMPVPGERSIKRISIRDSNGQPFSKPPKYGQTVKVEIETVNMLGENLSVGLWERDTMSSSGHSATDNENIWGSDKSYKVSQANGIVSFSFVLDPGWAVKANRSLFEGSTHEYYLLVKGYGAKTKYSHQQDVTDQVATVPTNTTQQNKTTPQTGGAAPKQSRLPAQPAHPAPAAGQNPSPTPAPAQPPAPQGTTAAPPPQGATPAPAPVQQQTTVQASGVGADPAPAATGGKSATTVEEEKVEGLIDAYFAKKEYTKKTGEAAATLEYPIKSNGNKTATDAEKKKIAGIILGKPEVKALAAKKEYTTEEAIIQALTKEVYNNGDKVTFATYKLGPEFKKIQNAPLEDKVYLVATSYLLDGKQATITVKEKDGLLKGAAGAALPILEITEQQMESKDPKVEGTEKTTFTGTIEKGMVKIPVQLRPKSDDDLKQWKDKLAKGKEDGTYTYTFAGTTSIADENEKKSIAGAILKNAKGGLRGNPKIEEGKTAYVDDIISALEIKTYTEGAQLSFKLYKKVPELLYLQVQAQGEKQHDKEFLKKDGAYFEIGKKCICEERIRAFLRTLRVGEGTGELIKAKDKVTKETIYIAHDFEKGYTTAFGGNLITDLSDHPRTNYGGSTAAGAYQVMKDTWDDAQYADKKTKYNINSFSKENQDKFSVLLMKHHPGCSDLLSILLSGQTENSIRGRASRIWASLPEKGDNSRYLFKGEPQPVTPMKMVLEHFDQFLADELAGNSPLHLQKGFLKTFEIPCNCGANATGNSSWHHPVDNPQLRGWYSVWAPERSIHSSNIPGRSKGKHDGVDLYAPTGTQLYACVDGEVNEIYTSESYGQCINLKGEYNGTTYYFFYAHLSSVAITATDSSGNPTKVKAGDPIGKSGKTGSSAAALNANQVHLHFELRTTSARTGGRIDPLSNIADFDAGVNKTPTKENQP